MKKNASPVKVSTVFLALTFSVCLVNLCAQAPMVAMPSPNAASLGTFGEIQVSGFTGVPNISIPIFDAQVGDLTVPISLNYHTSLVKPDHVPGWVGFGWNLTCGGSITRICRGNNLYDENINNGPNHSFLTWYEAIGQSDWTSYSNKINYLTDSYHPNNDYEPDQFSFNFGDYSGTFYLNHKGEWVVQSQKPMKLKITSTLVSSVSWLFGNAYSIDRYYKMFSILTEDGVEYVFGNDPEDQINDPVAIEFSVNATKNQSGDHQRNLIPTTWNLTKIISPSGWEINLSYVRGGGIYNLSRFITSTASMYNFNLVPCNGPLTPCVEWIAGTSSMLKGYNVNLIYPSYLDEITMSDNSHIKFNRSTSIQLDYSAADLLEYKTAVMGPTTSIRQKLDNITVYNSNGEVKNRFNFRYIESSATRLKLDKFEEVDGNGDVKRYQFGYNSTPLPSYNSGMIDHWGHYIGTSYYNSPADILTTRNVTPGNAPLMQAGILNKIAYPTGGYTEFEYEPHQYSSVVVRTPYFSVDNKGQNLLTGGVRIAAIRSRDANGTLLSERTYKYITNYVGGGTLSSGILAGEPRYNEEWDFGMEKYASFTDQIVQPMSYTNGNHITYSEVTERETGNGYKVYKFTNSDDPAYRDKEAYFLPDLGGNSRTYLPFNSLSYTRGNLLSETDYNESKTIQRETSFQYNYVPPNYLDANNTRALYYRWFSMYKVAGAYSDFTFCPYSIKRTVKEYDQNGLNPVTTVVDYTYTANNQLKEEKTVGSDGIKIVNLYKYPLDFSTSESPPEISRLKELNIIAPRIEKTTYQDLGATKKVIGGEYYEFKEFYPNIVKPWKIWEFNATTPPDFYSFYYKRRNVASSQNLSLSVDECCQLTDTKSFSIPNLGAGAVIQSTLTMHLENLSPYDGNFYIDISGPSGDYFQSYTVLGNTNGGIYTIDYTKAENLTPGNYTITLEYSGNQNSYYYGWCTLTVDVINGFQYNTQIEPRIILNYNNVGNIIESEKVDDYVTSYKWGYDNTLPTAQFINARDDESAFYDFESDTGPLPSIPPHTGLRCREGDFPSPFVKPNSKAYKISYWYYHSGEWKFSGVGDYTNNQTLTMGEAIDDVRIYPANAQATTYTYDPLVGATSASESNNIPNYYQYDSFNRLKVIRDKNSDILSLFNYNYKK